MVEGIGLENRQESKKLARVQIPHPPPKRGLSRVSLYNIDFGPRTSRPTCINSGFYIWACGGTGIHIGFKLRCRKD